MESSNSVLRAQFDESLEPERNQSASGIPAETRPAADELPEISSIEDSDPKEIVKIISPAETPKSVSIIEKLSNKNIWRDHWNIHYEIYCLTQLFCFRVLAHRFTNCIFVF